MKRYGPAFLVSLLLHAGLLALAYISWQTAPKIVPTSSVPVELVSSVPQHEMAEAPVDALAVKTPSPEPTLEEPVTPPPEPVPAPKLPVPAPQKAVTPAKPDKKPEPAKKAVVPPDKNGAKKPVVEKKTSAADDLLARAAAAPSKAPTRKQAVSNTHSTSGSSIRGSAPADAGTQTALDALTRRLARLWNPNCDVPGGNQVNVKILFTLSANGRVINGPDWTNPRTENVWVAGANRAKAAVMQGQPYADLPDGLYNVPLQIAFDATRACGN